MSNQITLLASKIDIDNEAVERFTDNELIYVKCLKRFLMDRCMLDVVSDYGDSDKVTLYSNCKHLTGAADNLGLRKIKKQLQDVAEHCFLEDEYFKELISSLQEEYMHICRCINQYA